MRHLKTGFKLKAIAYCVIAAFASNELRAQAIEEIIVAARKTEENVQDIPIALNAISSQMVSEKGITDIADVASLTAGLVFDEGLLPNDTRPVIRGLSATRGRANVATLIDDVDVTSESLTVGGGGMTGNMRLMDLERVEVVKGPQSVLYGRSAFTGAVNYINKRPEQDFGGQVDLDVDEFGSTETKLGITGGLTDELAARMNLATWDGQGWDYQNPDTGGDLGTGDLSGGSLAFEWLPTDEFSAYTRFDYSDEEYQPRATILRRSWLENDTLGSSAGYLPNAFTPATPVCASASLPSYFGGSCVPTLLGSLDAKESEIDLSPDSSDGGDFRGTELETFRAHLDLRWEFEDYELRSITASTQNNVNIQEDFDLTNYDLSPAQYGLSADTDISHDLEQFSQEFRALGTTDSFEWFVSGLYWSEELDTTWDDTFWLRNGSGGIYGAFGIPAPASENTSWASAQVAPATDLSRDTNHWSLAGSMKFHLTDEVSWTIEGRYLEEKVEYSGDKDFRGNYTTYWNTDLTWLAAFGNFNGLQAPSGQTICDASFAVIGDISQAAPCGTSENKITSYEFVPRTSIDWQVTEDALIYFTYAEGFKPGGVDTTAGSGDVSGDPYDPEELKTYEVGSKTAWLENSLLVNGGFFYYDYTNLQQSIQYQPAGGLTSTQVVNAGAVENKGFEFDVTYRILQELTVTVGYVYSNSTYEDFDLKKISAENGDVSGGVVSSFNRADAGNANGNYDGNQLPLSAKKAATLALRYEDEVAAGLQGFAEIAGNYSSERFITPGNNAYLPSYDVWGFSLGLDAEQWRAIVYVDNVFDDDKIKSGLSNVEYGYLPGPGFASPAGANLQLPQPRTIGIRGTYRF